MTELRNIMENGAGFSSAPSPRGFTAGSTWDDDAYYDLTRFSGKSATGTTPMPNQTKIDRFQREMARHFIELDVAEREETKARGALDEDQVDERSVEERLAEVDKILEMKREIYGKFADTCAALCSNKPTAKQLKDLPENELKRFINHITELIDPNV
jgi:hypothetical protein